MHLLVPLLPAQRCMLGLHGDGDADGRRAPLAAGGAGGEDAGRVRVQVWHAWGRGHNYFVRFFLLSVLPVDLYG